MSEIYGVLAMWSPVGLAFAALMIPAAKAVKAQRERRAFQPRPYCGEVIYVEKSQERVEAD